VGSMDPLSRQMYYSLSIPNKEVKYIYVKIVKRYFADKAMKKAKGRGCQSNQLLPDDLFVCKPLTIFLFCFIIVL
jgi:hypothetical protein